MSEDVTKLNQGKDNKNPLDSAVNQLKEAATKELNKKVSDAVKEFSAAKKVKDTALFKLKALLKEIEVEKSEFAELIKELK